MKYDCPYGILGLEKGSSKEFIKRAWRKLSEKYHSDTGGVNASLEEFNRVQWAYRFLTDDRKRMIYDQTGEIKKDHSATINQAARENLVLLFKKVLHTNEEFTKNFKGVNPFELMRLEISNLLLNSIKEVESLKGMYQKLLDIKSRIIYYGGDHSLLKDVLEKEIGDTCTLIEEEDRKSKTFKEMTKLLEPYKYRTDLFGDEYRWNTQIQRKLNK